MEPGDSIYACVSSVCGISFQCRACIEQRCAETMNKNGKEREYMKISQMEYFSCVCQVREHYERLQRNCYFPTFC